MYQRLLVICTIAAALTTGAASASQTPTAAPSTPTVAHCQTMLRITGHRAQGHPRTTSTFTATSGSASCTGQLGPWMMGGEKGWSTSAGTLQKSTVDKTPAGRACLPKKGAGSLWAEAPRYAWFHPPMVTVTSAFQLHQAGHSIALTGAGHLVRTRESPIGTPFTIAGTAKLTTGTGSSCNAQSWSGSLTLEFTVRTT